MLPVIALVGRPNVGKSTLFNRLTKSRDALVADLPGLTRDRKYGEGRVGEKDYIVVDTGGITGDEKGIDYEMARQSLQAVDEADIVLFLVDGRAGLTAGDEMIADHLRRSGKQAHLVVNKTDGQDPDVAAADFYSLGFASTFMIAASHNRGVRSMLELLLPSEEDREAADHADRYPGIRIGIVGRPNVGKSTLFNRITNSDVYAADQLFATLDTTTRRLYIPEQGDVVISDTVGFIRDLPHTLVAAFRATLEETVQADILLHVVDANNSNRDEQIKEVNKLLQEIGADAIPQIMVFNKIDLNDLLASTEGYERNEYGRILRIRLSAKTGEGLAYVRQALAEVKTKDLNEFSKESTFKKVMSSCVTAY